MRIGEVIPILRMFDIAKAREFYLGYLGFTVDWEHRFEPDLPLYMQISRDGCRIHVSEHYGDATPGSAIRVAIEGIDDYHAELASRPCGYQRPAIESMPWGTRELRLVDPFGNRLSFYEGPSE